MSIDRINNALPTTNKVEDLNDQTIELDGRTAQAEFDKLELDAIYSGAGLQRQFRRNFSLSVETGAGAWYNWDHIRTETGYSIWSHTGSIKLAHNANNEFYFDDKKLVYRGNADSENILAFGKVFTYDGASYTDVTTEAAVEGGQTFNLLADTDDYIYIGSTSQFTGIDFTLSTMAANNTLVVEYTTSTIWSTLNTSDYTWVDNTSALIRDGAMTFTAPTNWVTGTVNSEAGYYWIRISTSTTPVTTGVAYTILPYNSVPSLLSLSSADVQNERWAWCNYTIPGTGARPYITLRNTGQPDYEGDWFIASSSSATNQQNFFRFNHKIKGDYENSEYDFSNTGISLPGTITIPNEGLHLLDTNASHDLIIKPGSDLTADRILTITTGDAARAITLSGNPILADWFDQNVKSGQSPTFDGNNFTGIDANDVDIADSGGIITATEVEGTLQENRTAIDLNTTHRGSNGSDHSKVTANETAIAAAKLGRPNLFLNGNMEYWYHGTGGASVEGEPTNCPEGWVAASTAADFLKVAGVKTDPLGKNSDIFKCTAASGSDGILIYGSSTNWLKVNPSTEYTFSFYHKVDDVSDIITFSLFDFEAAVQGTVHAGSVDLSSTTSWQEYTLTFTTADDADNLQVGLWTAATGDIMYLSGFKLEEASTVSPYCPHVEDHLYEQETVWLNGSEAYLSTDAVANIDVEDGWCETINDILYYHFPVPAKMAGKTVCIDEITVHVTTVAAGDVITNAWLYANDLDGTSTAKITHAGDIGTGTGQESHNIVDTLYEMTDFPHYLAFEVSGTDTVTDVKINGIQTKFHTKVHE